MWFTSISGIFSPKAKDFAKEIPTNKEPISPGPRVKAIADNCFLSIFVYSAILTLIFNVSGDIAGIFSHKINFRNYICHMDM